MIVYISLKILISKVIIRAIKGNMKKQNNAVSVLIVDDELNICSLLQDVLKKNKYNATACNRGEQALEAINKGSFDIVVTDLKLPSVSGLEILECAKKREPYCEVIVITGYPTLLY